MGCVRPGAAVALRTVGALTNSRLGPGTPACASLSATHGRRIKPAWLAMRWRRRSRERRMNPKCQTQPEFDNLGAGSADSTMVFLMPINRAVSSLQSFDHLVGAGEKRRW